MKQRSISLKGLIAVLVFLIVLPFGSIVIVASYMDANEQLKAGITTAFQKRLAGLSVDIKRLLREGDTAEVKRLISLQGADASIGHFCLVDEQGTVLFTTHYAWQGRAAAEVMDGFNPVLFDRVKKAGTRLLLDDADNSDIDAYYAIDLPVSGLHQQRRIGALFGEYRYSTQFQALRSDLIQKLLFFLAGLMLFSLGLIAMLRRWIHLPLQQISAWISRMEAGTYGESIEVHSATELNVLAEKLTAMSQQLRQSHQALNDTHALLTSLIDSVPDLIFYKDRNSVYMGANRAFCGFVGKQQSDLIGLNDYDLFDKDVADFFREKDQAMLNSGEARRNEEWVDYPDGRRVLLDTLKASYVSKDGAIIGLIGISRDITEFDSLKAQFLQAQKMEAIGTLVGGIAHDFNNMLAGITGNIYIAKMMLDGNKDAQSRLDDIESLSFKAAAMIEQLLTFARKTRVKMQPLPLSPYIRETLKFLRATVPENILIEEHIEAGSLTVTGDETQIHQILMNLISNACDALADVADPMIQVGLEAVEIDRVFIEAKPYFTPGSYAHLSVRDNGCGVPEAQVAHLFEPFFTTKEQGKGTGLGLAMVFGAVKTHAGYVEVSSEQGSGTCFDIYIPLCEVTAAETERVALPPASGAGELILLVDDEELVRKTTAAVLESLGYTVVQAGDGDEGWQQFVTHQDTIALALLDVVMPHGGGVELAGRIRAVQPDLPIIFVTGYDQQHISDAEGQLPNTTVMGKPVKFDALSYLLRRLLNGDDAG